ncbi:hypothetical protein [Clostridium oryzae]|uniref:Uncharacterized protein n=1 Tax=Clostridium oryzae TaxID=1450648 RepID=A0A1V4I5J1_9CLOT|nr:hypothetical protein [Clostridium oryzae]OPJ55213.1 hypothetical protein CLORY_44510 [Clostridium oryzae]
MVEKIKDDNSVSYVLGNTKIDIIAPKITKEKDLTIKKELNNLVSGIAAEIYKEKSK